MRLLHDQHGPLMFHQSGGCCDGSLRAGCSWKRRGRVAP
ncbi:DUF779 domain-containing protein [Parasphingorhabdus pacifica]